MTTPETRRPDNRPITNRPFDGLIFDLDGVLTDTNRLHYESWSKLAQEEQFPLTQSDYDGIRGMSRYDGLRRLLRDRELDEITSEDWLTRKNNYFRELMQHLTPSDILPGVLDWIQEARRLGMSVGLGSASRNARDVLARLELDQAFDAIGDGTTVTNIKPAPDIFLWVAGRMNVTPARTLIVEDSEAGVLAGHAGGFRVIGVGIETLVRDADLYLPTLADLSLEAVCQRLWR